MSTDYQKQADDFLIECGATLTITKLGTFKYWPDDKEPRDVYRFIIKTSRGEYSGTFGDSLVNSSVGLKGDTRSKLINLKPVKVTSYDILACLTKYDPGTFSDFCGDFGYDEDSRKAEKVYFAVQNEWSGLRKAFDSEQLEKLQEIQ